MRLLYCEKTGDCADREEQVRRLNWATYSVNDDGRNRYPNDDIWLTDGYGDYDALSTIHGFNAGVGSR